MKWTAFLFSVGLASAAWADSPFEVQLQKLQAARDADAAKALAPIDKKLHDDLTELLEQAMKGGDLDAAIKIRNALRGKSTGESEVRRPSTSAELREFLHGTTWNISDRKPDSEVLYTLTFDRNGTFRHSDGRTGRYEATSGSSFIMWGYDPAVLNEEGSSFAAVSKATPYFGARKN